MNKLISPAGNLEARIRHRPESERWRVYHYHTRWKAAAPQTQWYEWADQADDEETGNPDGWFDNHAEEIAYADRMARHG